MKISKPAENLLTVWRQRFSDLEHLNIEYDITEIIEEATGIRYPSEQMVLLGHMGQFIARVYDPTIRLTKVLGLVSANEY